jgi:hypothetical protein
MAGISVAAFCWSFVVELLESDDDDAVVISD